MARGGANWDITAARPLGTWERGGLPVNNVDESGKVRLSLKPLKEFVDINAIDRRKGIVCLLELTSLLIGTVSL